MKVLLITVYVLYYSLCVDNECLNMILVGMMEIVVGGTVQKVVSFNTIHFCTLLFSMDSNILRTIEYGAFIM